MSATVSTGQLRLLVVLARAGVVATAAAELGISRRSVRHLARAFEQQIDVPLFVWSRHRVDVTERGGAFIARAQAVMDLLHRAVSRIDGNAEVLGQLELPPRRRPEDPVPAHPLGQAAQDALS